MRCIKNTRISLLDYVFLATILSVITVWTTKVHFVYYDVIHMEFIENRDPYVILV